MYVIPIWFNTANKLHSPLGPWTKPGSQLQRTCDLYYTPHSDTLYVLVELDHFHHYKRPSLDCDEFSFDIQTSWRPDNLSFPVHTSGSMEEWTIHHTLPQAIPSPPSEIPATFEEYLLTLPRPNNSLFQSVELHYDCYVIIDLVTDFDPDYSNLHVQLINVSDRSTFDSSMSFGWAMCLPNGTRLATCAGPAHGAKQSSFRAKGYGMLLLA
jgi:hypothetical protein